MQVVRAEAGVTMAALQAWLLVRGWELACADALPQVAGEATVGSLLAAWGGSLLGPRVHALTLVDHTGQVRLVFMFIEFGVGERLHGHAPRRRIQVSAQAQKPELWEGFISERLKGRAGEPSGHVHKLLANSVSRWPRILLMLAQINCRPATCHLIRISAAPD